ncbi:MAG: flotillin family protein [Burkholderiaceae bacterium]
MEPILISVAALVILVFVLFAMFAKFYRKIEQGHALIVNTMRAEPTVTFTGCMVYPVIHKAELMEISVKTIEIDRSGREGLICKDNIRADIKVKFFVRVNKTSEDVLKVAQGVGCERASNQDALEDLFSAKFSEALKTVGKSMEFVDLYQARDHFRDEIIRQIGDDLSGYVLEDAAIDYLEQTPLSKLDSSNILDAQGIKKITELTAVESVRTNELRRNEEMQIKKKNVETQETLLELDRQAADAQARQSREVASVRAREEAETAKVQAEERTKSEMARLQGEQTVAVQNENSQREKEVAENNRKRAVAIEEEKVTRARELEVVDREKEVALQKIDKERALEVQKKAIADVIRERIVVDRTVAEQEEAIKELRMVSEAERNKKSTIILAEGEAEQLLITEVKAAEAQERRARHKATEDITLADAHLKVSEKNAESKKREAEGIEAIGAAPGLAAARVATVTADARHKQGMVEVQVKEAAAIAEANGLRAKFEAEAQGKEKLGLADVQVRTAGAEATIKVGDADAQTVQARFSAEAKGLREKFEAMKAMSPETRDHEEFRMRLEMLHVETLKGIEAQMVIAKEQAEVLGKALANAKIEMVGGDGSYFDRFVNALAVGKGIDGAIAKSDTLKIALKDHLNGDRNMVDDVGRLVGALGDSSSELKDLAIVSLLNKNGKDGKAGGSAV